MREFFRGWKRKLGVVTLLMACLFIACWLRSECTYDAFILPFGFGVANAYPSGGHAIGRARDLSTIHTRDIRFTGREPALYTESGTFLLNPYVTIRYKMILLPLAALSAYLLLSTPRVKKSVPENRV